MYYDYMSQHPTDNIFWFTVYKLLFWYRKWEVVRSVMMVNTRTKNRRLLVLEQCKYTGFERAYYSNGDKVSVELAKIRMEMMDKSQEPD